MKAQFRRRRASGSERAATLTGSVAAANAVTARRKSDAMRARG
jgi:hypothetical protein